MIQMLMAYVFLPLITVLFALIAWFIKKRIDQLYLDIKEIKSDFALKQSEMQSRQQSLNSEFNAIQKTLYELKGRVEGKL